jgi:asparagine synthase (glutamine-hydrolysing)
MPGIVGIITKMPREWADPRLARMVNTLRHETSYATGSLIDESLGSYVGWAARKGSFSDGMPLRNERGDVALIFSGEEFPEPGTPRRLKDCGHAVEGNGPSYLVHLYEEDSAFPATLNGRFHGVVLDWCHRKVTLFNDRYGTHRIYYVETKEAFYFAAEVKAILAVCPELRKLDPRGLGEFVSCGCVLENRTLFEGIHVLPPGSAWVLRDSSIEERRAYFDPQEWEDQERLGPEDWYRELKGVFIRNLPRFFVAREHLGMSLTGGLDCRMIMAWHKASPGSLPCYTFGGTYRECQDVTVGRRVAKACGQPHQVITIGSDFLSRFPHYAERAIWLSDGCVELSRAPDLYANEKAREIAPVRMTGNYGSEVLRWAPAFKPALVPAGLFRGEFLTFIEAASLTYACVARGHPVSFAVFRQAPWHHYGLSALEHTQVSVRSPYLDNDFVRAAFRAPTPVFSKRDTANVDLCLRLIAEGDADLRLIQTDRGLGGREGIGATLKHHVREFTFKAEYAYDYGMPQWVARIDHILSPFHLENLFLGRHKFYHFRVWYRDALANYVRGMLLDPRTLSRPYLHRNMVETIVDGHLRLGLNYTTEIHKILTLELIHRLFLD